MKSGMQKPCALMTKNRNGPAMMDIEMHFDEHLTHFRDRAPRGVDEAAIKPEARMG